MSELTVDAHARQGIDGAHTPCGADAQHQACQGQTHSRH